MLSIIKVSSFICIIHFLILSIGPSTAQEFRTDENISEARTTSASVQDSDINLKKDVVEIADALEKISRLRGVSFFWKDQTREKGRQLGLIAQEVEREFPELVRVQVDDGSKGVAYTGMIGPLVAAVKQLKADNDNLRSEIVELRHTVEGLSAAR